MQTLVATRAEFIKGERATLYQEAHMSYGERATLYQEAHKNYKIYNVTKLQSYYVTKLP